MSDPGQLEPELKIAVSRAGTADRVWYAISMKINKMAQANPETYLLVDHQ